VNEMSMNVKFIQGFVRMVLLVWIDTALICVCVLLDLKEDIVKIM